MEEVIEVTLRVTSVLEDLGVTYLVGGSLKNKTSSALRLFSTSGRELSRSLSRFADALSGFDSDP